MLWRPPRALAWGLVALAACSTSDAYSPPPAPTQQPATQPQTQTQTQTQTAAPAPTALATEAPRERWGPCALAPGQRCRAAGLPWLQSNKLDVASRATLAAWKPEDGLVGVRVDESGRRVVVQGCQLPGEYSELRRGYAVRPPDPIDAQAGEAANTSPPRANHEQLKAAKEAFIAGQQAFERGDYLQAHEAFETAYKHAPRPELALNSARALARSIERRGTAPAGSVQLALERLEPLLNDSARPEVRSLAAEVHQWLQRYRGTYGLGMTQETRRPESVSLSWEGFLYRARVEPGAELPARCESATHALVSFARWRGPTRARQLGAGVTGILAPLAELAAREADLPELDDCFAGVLYESCEVPVATMERFGE